MEQPNVIILAGPNGAGKSTMSEALFGGHLETGHYVNADTIARGLSVYRPLADVWKLFNGPVPLPPDMIP
jgi:predicted ABC-type ATPase